MEDTQLWLGLKNGDHVAFKGIYEQYAAGLIRYGSRFTNDVTIVEDCLHDLFVSLWKQHHSLGETNCIMSYLCVSLRREIIRKLKKPTESGSESIENLRFETELSPEDMMLEKEFDASRKAKLQQAMNILSNRQKEAIYLRYYEEMEYEDICGILGINYQSVRNLIFRALKQIRDSLAVAIIFINISGCFEYILSKCSFV